MTWWVDGRERAGLPVDDRGLHYGDGVFETIAVRDGEPVRLKRHLARLSTGLERLGIAFSGHAALEDEARRACSHAGRAVLKLIVTRGGGGRGYRPPVPHDATRIVGLGEWPSWPPGVDTDGVCVRVCDTRLSHQPKLAGIKHLNRLDQVLARAEWRDDSRWQEGLMLDTHGDVIEATQSNVFAVESGRLLTPGLTGCGIAGIIRGVILEDAAAALGIDAEVRVLPLERLLRCDEVFLCNSLIGVWPVREIDGTALDAPGDVTRRLSAWLARHDR